MDDTSLSLVLVSPDDEWPAGCPPVYWVDNEMTDWERNVIGDMLIYGWYAKDKESLPPGSGMRVWGYYNLPQYMVVGGAEEVGWHGWWPNIPIPLEGVLSNVSEQGMYIAHQAVDARKYLLAPPYLAENFLVSARTSKRTQWWKSLPWTTIALSLSGSV